MGGMVAQELVLAHPERVRTLMLGCSFPGGSEAKMTDQEIVGMIAEAVLSGDGERAAQVGYEVMIAPEYAADPANYETYAKVAAQYPAPIPTLMGQLSAILAHDTSERLSEIAVPTLVVHGTADRLLESVNGELLARLIPDARLELIDGAGHMFFWEQPERAARLVREHVASAARA
jgi:pimeloyl-ACP methyl ester carboxylesterase